jgi:hypothetical protein
MVPWQVRVHSGTPAVGTPAVDHHLPQVFCWCEMVPLSTSTNTKQIQRNSQSTSEFPRKVCNCKSARVSYYVIWLRNFVHVTNISQLHAQEHLQQCSICDLAKIFFISKFSNFCFATPPIKLKLAQRKGKELLIASNLDQSLWSTNQKHWALVRSYLVHSCLQVRRIAVLFTSHYKLWNLLSQRGMFCLFFIQFYYAHHKLSVHSWRCLKVILVTLSSTISEELDLFFC